MHTETNIVDQVVFRGTAGTNFKAQHDSANNCRFAPKESNNLVSIVLTLIVQLLLKMCTTVGCTNVTTNISTRLSTGAGNIFVTPQYRDSTQRTKMLSCRQCFL